MVKRIFWRENNVNGKKLKTPNKILPGERKNLRGDRSAKSKYNGFMTFHQVIPFIIHLLYNIILYIENAYM